MKTIKRIICAAVCVLLTACFFFGCDNRAEEKIGYFKGTSFFMGGKEYLPVEETENMIYIKDKCLGISEDGEKYIYSVANDDNKEFILTASRGLIPGEDHKLYSSVDFSEPLSDKPSAVYLADKYKIVYIQSYKELDECLSSLENDDGIMSSYKYSEFSEREIRIYYCFDGKAVSTVKKGVLIKTGAGWVYTPAELFGDEKNGILKGKIISDSNIISFFENKMK